MVFGFIFDCWKEYNTLLADQKLNKKKNTQKRI